MDSSNAKATLASDIMQKDIFDLIGLSDLDEAKKDGLREKFTTTIENNVFASLTNDLVDAKLLGDFEKLKTDKEYEKFFKEHNIDMEQYFIEEALRLKAQLKTASDLINAGVKLNAKKA